jgi:hypothetical protein
MEIVFCWEIVKEAASIKDGGILRRKKAHGGCGHTLTGQSGN